MKRTITTILLAVVCTLSAMAWKPRIAMQSFTFHKFTLVEALDKCQQLGIHYIEVYPGHRLGGKWGEQAFSASLDTQTQKEVRKLARQKGVKIVATGVFVSDDPEEWVQLFRFAHDMKMEYVTCEPPLELWDLVEQLAVRYNIKVAVHNHPQPSTYWNPDALLSAISERSKLIGSCSDVGHWKREGLDHLACLRKLQGRIVSLHFKDIIARPTDGSEQHDCIWGQGILDVPQMLSILKEQKVKGYMSIEYEYNWDNSVTDIRSCLDTLK